MWDLDDFADDIRDSLEELAEAAGVELAAADPAVRVRDRLAGVRP